MEIAFDVTIPVRQAGQRHVKPKKIARIWWFILRMRGGEGVQTDGRTDESPSGRVYYPN